MEAAGVTDTLRALQPIRTRGHEVIVVDGGSTDRTVELARPLCDNLLLFLHADTRLPENTFEHLASFVHSRRAWGRFDVQLSGERPLFRVIAWFMNQRSRLTGICTGDQAMFVRRDAFEALGGFHPMPLMEDVEFSRRLCLVSRPFCIKEPVVTDSRRWQNHGAWRTIFLMWQLRWRYWRGESPESLAQIYRSDVRNASK